MTSSSLESSKALKGNIKFWRPPTLFFSLIIFPHFPPLSLYRMRVGKRQLRETQNSQMFQIWKRLIKVFPHIGREVGKTVFLWNSHSWNEQNIPGFCIHHSPIFWARTLCFILCSCLCECLWEIEPCPDDLTVYSDQTDVGWGLKRQHREGKWLAQGRAAGQWLKRFPITQSFL